jgi:hypothetical protein
MSDDGMQFSTTPASVKASVQLNKMKEANLKYKSLLKLAKERIQAQEEELESLRGTFVHLISIAPRASDLDYTFTTRKASLIHPSLSLLSTFTRFLFLYSEHESNGRTNKSGANRSDYQHCNGG